MPNGNAPDIVTAQLNYAWGWWQFHGKQRTDMFNYYLIITGILANAYVNVWSISRNGFGTALGILGILASVGFLMLDIRNRQQLERATCVLDTVEKSGLGVTLANIDPPSLPRRFNWARNAVTHRFVFRAVELLVALGWLIAIVTAFRKQ